MGVFRVRNGTASIDQIDHYKLGHYINRNEAARIVPIHEGHPTISHLEVNLERVRAMIGTTEVACRRA